MAKIWKVGIVKDTARPMLGLHGLHNAFRGLPNVEVAAHVDSNTDNLERKLEASGAKRHYADYGEMLDRESPDIVVLCSRHPADHLSQIESAARRGCHIYCEKPLTADLEEADEIVRIAEASRIKICVAHPARYDLAFLTMKRMVEDGAIGTPAAVYGRGKCDHRGGGEDLIVLGTHVLDLEVFLFGAPEYVLADVTSAGRPVAATDRTATVEPIGPAAGDAIHACFRFPGDVRGIFESRRGLWNKDDGAVHMGVGVVGSRGALAMRFIDGAAPEAKLRINRRSCPPEDGVFEDVPLREDRVIPGAEPLDFSRCGTPDVPAGRMFLTSNRHAAWDLMRSIEEDRLPVSNIYNARLVQEMIQGIYASAVSRSVAVFPLADRRHPLR